MNNLNFNSEPKIIVVLGPTASGKSDLAVGLAKKFNAEIISADSRQVYKGLDIGSGKVPRDFSNPSRINSNGNRIFKNNSRKGIRNKFKRYIYKDIPHHLLDVASPKRTFTAAQYQKLAKKAIKKILAKGKIPIICGGTGFYIDALIYNYQLPAVPPQLKLRKQLEKKSAQELFQQLKKLDPRRSKNIDCHNKRRLIRALEIILTTNKPVPLIDTITRDSVNEGPIKPSHKPPYQILKIGIKKSPDELKELIAKRLKKRLKQGLIKEIERLHDGSGLSPEGKPSASYGVNWQRLDDLGLEYRYVSRFLRQRALINADQTLINAEKIKIVTELKRTMVETLGKEIYRYAKRQITWFKKDKEIHWIKNQKESTELIKKFLGL